jgi:predicted alpha/beta superfamily hydrolase
VGLLAAPGVAAAQAAAHDTEVTLPGTELHTLHSAVTGITYRIYVGLPQDYVQHADAHYPVVYLLDASVEFGIAHQVLHLLADGKLAREAILVGIAFDTKTMNEGVALRSTEMTTTSTPDVDSAASRQLGAEVRTGGAAKFLSALKTEVVPFIEKHFRASSERVFVGYSYGGLFGGYVLFHEPGLFQGYLLGSPSFWWDYGALFRDEKQYADTHKDLAARVFLSYGSLEDSRPSDP